MSELAGGVLRRIRRWAFVLRHSPLHPQWVTFRFKELASRRVASLASGDLLDIGCADGALRRRLPASVRYVGLDYPATATALYGTRPDVFGDAQRLPFRDASFDRVVVLDVLEHLREPDACLAEAARMLRPDGRVLVHVPFAYPLHDRPHDYWRLTEHGLAAIADRAGLRAEAIVPCGHAIESAGLLLNLALAQAVVAAGRAFRPLLVLGIVLAPVVLLVNATCWILSRVLPAVDFLPVSYWAVLAPAGGARES